METARSPPDWRCESRVVRGSFSLGREGLVKCGNRFVDGVRRV